MTNIIEVGELIEVLDLDGGVQGLAGTAATIEIGTVTTGTPSSVTNVGTTTAAILDFVLEKGDQGEPGYAPLMHTLDPTVNQDDITKEHSLAWWISYFDGAEATIRVLRDTHQVTADMTVPENICLKFDKGARLKVSDTKTLTINGSIEAGLWQIFSGDGAVVGVPLVTEVYPEWFGAIGDGVADDTVALQAAADFVKQTLPNLDYQNKNIKGITLKGASVVYHITATVTFQCTGDFGSSAIVADSSFTPAIRIGSNVDGSSLAINFITPCVINSSKTSVGWGLTQVLLVDAVGIEFSNLYESEIYCTRVVGFGVGVDISAYEAGCAYNSFKFGVLLQNKIGLRIQPKSLNGWCNENIYYNLNVKMHSYESANSEGTRFILIDKYPEGPYSPDQNLFIKPCLEGSIVEYKYQILNGDNTTFLQARWEGSAPVFDESNGTMVIGGSNLTGQTEAGSAQSKLKTIISPAGLKMNTYNGFFLIAQNSEAFSEGFDKNYVGNGSAYNISRLDTDWVYQLLINGLKLKTSAAAPGESNVFLQTNPPMLYMRCEGEGVRYIKGHTAGFQVHGSLLPVTDNYGTLGGVGLKWASVYATNGTIQTSDERAKAEISSIPDEWLDAWGDVDYTRFKMVDAVQKKGSDNARWHIGLISQRVKEAFEARGLDAMKIGLLCYDEWDDIYDDVEVIDVEEVIEDGQLITPQESHWEKKLSKSAGNLYSIRYDEALAMEAAYMRREVERLKCSINV